MRKLSRDSFLVPLNLYLYYIWKVNMANVGFKLLHLNP